MTLTVFLSASIPLLERNEVFWKSADNLAIRDAVKALVSEIIYHEGRLVFGGHPAITPLVSYMFREMNLSPRKHVTLYQSQFFRKDFPPENDDFPSIILTEDLGSRERSLLEMRRRMLTDDDLSCAVFVGGMEGIFEEYELLRKFNASVTKYPIASTGAAAKIAYSKYNHDMPELVHELTYSTLFRRLFKQHLE